MLYNQHANSLGKAAEIMNITFSGSRGTGGRAHRSDTEENGETHGTCHCEVNKPEYLKTHGCCTRFPIQRTWALKLKLNCQLCLSGSMVRPNL